MVDQLDQNVSLAPGLLSVFQSSLVHTLSPTHCASIPPSTGNATPVTHAASSLARNSAPFATSSLSPHVPHGVRFMSRSLSSFVLKSALVIAVLVTRQEEVSKSRYSDPATDVETIMVDGGGGGRTTRAQSVAVNPIPGVVNCDLFR